MFSEIKPFAFDKEEQPFVHNDSIFKEEPAQPVPSESQQKTPR